MFVLVKAFSFKFCMDLLVCVLYCFPLLNYSLPGLLKVAEWSSPRLFQVIFQVLFFRCLLAVVLVGIWKRWYFHSFLQYPGKKTTESHCRWYSETSVWGVSGSQEANRMLEITRQGMKCKMNISFDVFIYIVWYIIWCIMTICIMPL